MEATAGLAAFSGFISNLYSYSRDTFRVLSLLFSGREKLWLSSGSPKFCCVTGSFQSVLRVVYFDWPINDQKKPTLNFQVDTVFIA